MVEKRKAVKKLRKRLKRVEEEEAEEDFGGSRSERDEPESEEEEQTGPGKAHGERFFGPATKMDWNRINQPDFRYPIRFPAEYENRVLWQPDDGWPPGSFSDSFFYWMEALGSNDSVTRIASWHLYNRFKRAQGAEEYFGQGGNFSDLPRMQKQPLSPTDPFTKNYLKFWENDPFWRVFWHDELDGEECSVHDRGNEWFEFYRPDRDAPELYQKWVERREVRKDLPQPALPIGSPAKVFRRKLRKRHYSSYPPLYLKVTELLGLNEEEMSKKAWTMAELVRQTIRRNKVKAKNCSVRMLRSDLKQLLWNYKVTCSEEGSDPGGHICRIKVLPKYKGISQTPEEILGQDFSELHIGVKCSCPAFRFWGPSFNSWALGFGYSSREDSGAAPSTNVRHKLPLDGSVRRALLCKHLIACSEDWMSRVLTEE